VAIATATASIAAPTEAPRATCGRSRPTNHPGIAGCLEAAASFFEREADALDTAEKDLGGQAPDRLDADRSASVTTILGESSEHYAAGITELAQGLAPSRGSASERSTRGRYAKGIVHPSSARKGTPLLHRTSSLSPEPPGIEGDDPHHHA
jgi:hypothetical protein